MDDVEVDVRNMAVKSGEQELWTEQNGHMSWGKPRPNLESCSAKQEKGGGDGDGEGEGEDDSYLITLHHTQLYL
jgi:hypothetical protein